MTKKTYVVNVTARGGAWRGMRQRFAVIVEAANKPEAGELAMDKVQGELKGQYDSLHVVGCKLGNHLKGA